MKRRGKINKVLLSLTLAEYELKKKEALKVNQRIEDAVIQIFNTVGFEDKLYQVASGVVVNIKEEYFIFSASHVFDDIGSHVLLVGGSDSLNRPIETLSGERFSSGKGRERTHANDPIDASVFHINLPISEALKKRALNLNDFDITSNRLRVRDREHGQIYIAAGFRTKKSYFEKRGKKFVINSKREGFALLEADNEAYTKKNRSKDTALILNYPNKNVKWDDLSMHESPILKGFSGGAIIKVEGVSMKGKKGMEKKQLLTAIVIEMYKGQKNESGILIGTRIDIFLLLINHFLPNLLKGTNISFGNN